MATIKKLARAQSRSKSGKQATRKSPKPAEAVQSPPAPEEGPETQAVELPSAIDLREAQRRIVRACDEMGQVMAALHAEAETSGEVNLHEINDDLLSAFTTLWRARWDLGLHPDAGIELFVGGAV